MPDIKTSVSPEVVDEMRADAQEVLDRREPVVLGDILDAMMILGSPPFGSVVAE